MTDTRYNPYAPPQSLLDDDTVQQGCYHIEQTKHILLHSKSDLPPYCISCGIPVNKLHLRKVHTIKWYPGWFNSLSAICFLSIILLSSLLSPFINSGILWLIFLLLHIIVKAIVTRKRKIHINRCHHHHQRWFWFKIISYLLIISSFAITLIVIILFNDITIFLKTFWIAFFIYVCGSILNSIANRHIPKSIFINEEYAVLNKASNNFLNQLPQTIAPLYRKWRG